MSSARDGSERLQATIALLGGPAGDPVVDFLLDPGAACAALLAADEHGGVVVRVAPDLGTTADDASHGPVPRPPLFLRVMRGAREVGLAAGGGGMVRQAERVEIEERELPCCDAATCERRRVAASVWLALADVREKAQDPDAPRRVLVAEQRVLAEGGARPSGALAVARALATALDVPLVRAGAEVAPDDAEHAGEAPAPHGELLTARDLARFALRSEGSLVVLRDWESVGPRASAPRNAVVGGVLLAAAAGALFQLWRSFQAGANNEAIAAGATAALLALAGYAFLGVARFSSRYRATSAPLMALGPDRIVVLPWVSRDGAVDQRPDGRLGAAIGLGDVTGLGTEPRPREGGVAVVLLGGHGPIDVMVCPTAAVADAWQRALDRVVTEARHPRKGATARQKLRARAA
jgi:hypothetical protein